eukprot:m.40670 g.40670  ORF g.40670 m.40670 type:complete len:391 (+) comp11919_c0_seq1:525-1697(+)
MKTNTHSRKMYTEANTYHTNLHIINTLSPSHLAATSQLAESICELRLQRHQQRRVDRAKAGSHTRLVRLCQFCAQQEAGGLVDACAAAVAKVHAVDAELRGDLSLLWGRLRRCEQRRQAGRLDAVHQNVALQFLWRQRAQFLHELLVEEVVAAALALRLEHIIARIGHGLVNDGAEGGLRRVLGDVQRVQVGQRVEDQCCVAVVEIALQNAELGEHLLHFLGACELVGEVRALDGGRLLQLQPRVPVLLRGEVVWRVPRPVVDEGDLSHHPTEQRCGEHAVGLKHRAGADVLQGHADEADVVQSEQVTLEQALVKKVALWLLNYHEHDTGQVRRFWLDGGAVGVHGSCKAGHKLLAGLVVGQMGGELVGGASVLVEEERKDVAVHVGDLV